MRTAIDLDGATTSRWLRVLTVIVSVTVMIVTLVVAAETTYHALSSPVPVLALAVIATAVAYELESRR